MGIPENQRAKLHDTDETTEIEDFGIGISSVENARKVE